MNQRHATAMENTVSDSITQEIPAERHPLEPFLPEKAKILMLGSFPPKKERWSMEFFYPNFNNDMWRIMGLIFFGDRHYFEKTDGGRSRHFDKEKTVAFCAVKGIALYDSASEVRRLKDNASDKFLEIVRPTDISALLSSLPECHAIVTTGEKAAEAVASYFRCPVPAVGECRHISFMPDAGSCRSPRKMSFWRLPSSSRAYPLALEKKAEAYRKMFISEGFRL